MRRVALVLAAMACGAGSAAVAAPDASGPRPDITLPLEGVVTHPDWVETPNGDDFATYFPPVAEMLGLGGRIVMQCQVAAVGTMENCRIAEETPVGMGFGEAALKMTQFFRMKPMSVDGVPVAGAKINIPIRFAEPEQSDDATVPVDGDAAPSPKALELARRIAASNFGPAQMQFYMDQARRLIGERLAGVSLTEPQQAAIEDYVQAMGASGPARADALGRRYAREFTEQQLTEIDAFLESPTGRAWVTRGVVDQAQLASESAQLQSAVQADAKQRFCSKYICLKTTPAPAAAAPKK